MTINTEIREILRTFSIPVDDGLSYLISVYYDVRPSYTPLLIVEKINRTGIIVLEMPSKTIRWNIPLFNEQPTNFEWVMTDWMIMFAKANKERKGGNKECVTRMKKFFAENPDIRKDEVMGATEMYFKTVTNPSFVITSHYFITKGMGADRVSALLQWVEKYREAGSIANGRSSHNNTMR